MALRGLKRKSDTPAPHSAKRFRPGAKFDDLDLSDIEDILSASEDQERGLDTAATTPITPNSPSSHKHPSDLRKIHICTFEGCQKAFNRPAKLAQHVRSHTNERPFVCPHTPCDKSFLRDSHLKHHIKSAHTGERRYKCNWEGCQKSFLTATRLKRHIAGHEGHDHLTCKVEGCGQVFRKHNTLQAHVMKVHEGRKPHACAFLDEAGKMCGMTFDTAGQLRSHEGRIHQRKIFECTMCRPGEDETTSLADFVIPTFSTYKEFQNHMALEHPPVCDECGLACASKSALKSHFEVKHGGVSVDERKTHICPDAGCGAAFTKKGNLNIHLQTIHNDKRYVCEFNPKLPLQSWDGSGACGLSFRAKAELVEHIRIAHLGLAPEEGRRAASTTGKTRRRKIPTITKITGISETSKEDEMYTCAIQGCNSVFSSTFEHEAHLRARHGLAECEVSNLTGEARHEDLYSRSDLQGGYFFATLEELDVEKFFDMQFRDDYPLNHENAADSNIWQGEGENEMAVGTSNWLRDEAAMRQLIDEGDLGGRDPSMREDDTMEVDPRL